MGHYTSSMWFHTANRLIAFFFVPRRQKAQRGFLPTVDTHDREGELAQDSVSVENQNLMRLSTRTNATKSQFDQKSCDQILCALSITAE
jgi:hypothetical protein